MICFGSILIILMVALLLWQLITGKIIRRDSKIVPLRSESPLLYWLTIIFQIVVLVMACVMLIWY